MQNASEKMVPIDTSGDPVEVELNDEKEQIEVKEEPQKEIEVQQEEIVEQEEPKKVKEEEEVPVDPYETGDLDSYSKGVKKRINNRARSSTSSSRRSWPLKATEPLVTL